MSTRSWATPLADRPATTDDVAAIAGTLPETEFGITWGDRPTWKVPAGPKGKGFLLYRAPRKDAVDPETGAEYDDLIVIRTADAGDKQALVDDERLPFFTIDHFKNFNAVLVSAARLGELTFDELTEVITEAWIAVAPPKLRKAFLEERRAEG
ncbi:MAG: hypothetical protein NTV23_01730 [Propionibacteriales bacterium]|nr:hypothetical protein [Propionibacteriales bacterium]